MASVGLVVRLQAVEVVRAQRTGKGFSVLKHSRVSIKGSDDSNVVDAIKAALEQAQVRESKIGVTLSPQDVLLRSFTIPNLPKSEWKSAIQFEARKYIPFRTEELIWGFHAVEVRETKQISVTFAGVRVEVFRKINEWLKTADVKVAWIEAPWASLARVVDATRKKQADGFSAIIDLEPHVAHLVVVKEQIPCLARDISLAMLSELGSDKARSSDPQVEKLLTELRLSFDFFTRENPSASINRVLFFGDMETINSWCTWLAPQMPCQVGAGILPLDSSQGEAVDLSFALALGVALRELRPTQVKLDLSEKISVSSVAPAVQTPKWLEVLGGKNLDPKFVQEVLKFAPIQAGVAVLLVVLTVLAGSSKIASLNQQLRAAVSASEEVEPSINGKPISELQTIQQQVESNLGFIRQQIKQRVSLTEKINLLASLLPEGIWLDKITFVNPIPLIGGTESVKLSLFGNCRLPNSRDELEAIGKFLGNIKNNKSFFNGFETAQLGQITEQTNSDFDVSFKKFNIACSSKAEAV